VGGGILGLSVGREILLRSPDSKILLLEKESEVATHQTGHNSGVIHSGIYYPSGSEKAEGCREGIRLLNVFSEEYGIPRKRVGKVIVASHKSEFAALQTLFEQGLANQIPGLRMLSSEELHRVEPRIQGFAALHLPEVALIDFRKVSEALKKDILKRGGQVVLHQKVTAIESREKEVRVRTEAETYTGSFLFNCAGLHADLLAGLAGSRLPARIIPFRGEYFRLAPRAAQGILGLVYPAPDPRLPFLGVHLTPDFEGGINVGPNAVLAWAREGYRRGQMKGSDIGNFLSYGGFWRMAAKYWRTGLFETVRSWIKPLYAASVRKFLPEIKSSDLLPGGSGVRAQAVDPKGNLIHDFLFVESPRAIHVLNAPSPAATASLALAQKIVNLSERSS